MSQVLYKSEKSWYFSMENLDLVPHGREPVRWDSRSKTIFNSGPLSAWEKTWGRCSLQKIVGGQGVCRKVKLLTYTGILSPIRMIAYSRFLTVTISNSQPALALNRKEWRPR